MVVTRTQARGRTRRAAIYECVWRRWQSGQSAPTIREIAAEINASVATVHRHVGILVRDGQLQGRGRDLRPAIVD